MPEVDLSPIIVAAQEESKNAHENFRSYLLAQNSYLLAQNERLQSENDSLKNLKEELKVENGRLGMMVNLYEVANWYYTSGTVLFAVSGVCSGHVWDWFFWLLFCVGVLCFCVGLIPKVGIFRNRRSSNS